jgi:peptide/nickel transport system permease protein
MKKLSFTTKAGLFIIGLFFLIGLFAPFLSTHNAKSTQITERFSPPSKTHWLGQDKLGGDIYSKIIYGARISLTVAVFSTLISLLIGLIFGSFAGYFGGWLDELLMRIVDILLAFPGLLLIFALAAFLNPSIYILILIFSVVGWTGFARVARAQVLLEKEKDFVQAARSLGAKDTMILIKHIWPNILAPLIIQASFSMGGIIIGESSLSFLGVGVPPDIPSWGNMLFMAKQSSFQPGFVAIFPGVAIMITVLGFNFIGDGLRDYYDPKLSS